MKKIRNLSHYLLGFTFLYRIGNETFTNDFWLWQKIVGSIFIGLIFGGFIGAIWELVNKIFFDIQANINDVIRMAMGGFLGCLTACFFIDVKFITFWMFYACIALIIVDLTRATIKKFNE